VGQLGKLRPIANRPTAAVAPDGGSQPPRYHAWQPLTPDLEQFVQSRVASARYQTASEVVREGLRLLEEREQARATALKELRAKIQRGVEQADRGELLDGDAVYEEIRQLSARRGADDRCLSSAQRARTRQATKDDGLPHS
jgi:antitoxin ParD1/3/4